jgi:hypothetical protein
MAEPHPLELAAIAVRDAVDSDGLKVFLVPTRDIFDADKVRTAMLDIAEWFDNLGIFLKPNGEETAARNLALLANLLAEILSERKAVAA